jgi:hypothetical protein
VDWFLAIFGRAVPRWASNGPCGETALNHEGEINVHRFLIATAVAALLAASVSAPSLAQVQLAEEVAAKLTMLGIDQTLILTEEQLMDVELVLNGTESDQTKVDESNAILAKSRRPPVPGHRWGLTQPLTLPAGATVIGLWLRARGKADAEVHHHPGSVPGF